MTDVYPSRSMTQESNGTVGTAATREELSQIASAAVEWLSAERKISRETLSALGVTCGRRYFRDSQGELPAIIFKYRGDSWKARSFPDKQYTASRGFKYSFWNIDAVLKAAPEEVYIVEGEIDALSLVEAGVPFNRVLSVPGGAKIEPQADPVNSKGYQYVLDAMAEGLSRTKRFIWCGDSDGPGLALREDMSRLLPKALFSYVEWPEGYKDANDLLVLDGPDFLIETISAPKPWPLEGLYRMGELPEPPRLTLWHPGFPEWENKVMLAPKTLSVVTGQPNHGKTALFQQVWYQVARQYDVVCCIASFETGAKPHIRRQLRTLYNGKMELALSDVETAAADKWIDDHYVFLVHPERRPTLSWFLDMSAAAVVRYGAQVIQLDPWNRLEAGRDKTETETDYIGRCLRELHTFAHEMNVHVQIVAHPAKMGSERRNSPPSLEDIGGSKHWENMVDQGFVVHRPQMFDGGERKTEAHLFHKKARFEELGYPCKLNLDYKLDQRKYVSVDYKAASYGG